MTISDTSTRPPSLDAGAIARLSASYAEARILHSAVEVGLFELLAEGPLGQEAICGRLELHPRLVRDFLGAVSALGLIERAGASSVSRRPPSSSSCPAVRSIWAPGSGRPPNGITTPGAG